MLEQRIHFAPFGVRVEVPLAKRIYRRSGMGVWMLIVIAGACVGLGLLMILLTAQHLNSEITELTQRIEELERELLRAEEEQPESENR